MLLTKRMQLPAEAPGQAAEGGPELESLSIWTLCGDQAGLPGSWFWPA